MSAKNTLWPRGSLQWALSSGKRFKRPRHTYWYSRHTHGVARREVTIRVFGEAYLIGSRLKLNTVDILARDWELESVPRGKSKLKVDVRPALP